MKLTNLFIICVFSIFIFWVGYLVGETYGEDICDKCSTSDHWKIYNEGLDDGWEIANFNSIIKNNEKY